MITRAFVKKKKWGKKIIAPQIKIEILSPKGKDSTTVTEKNEGLLPKKG